LRHDHINLHGRYYFTPSDAITRGELRNLPETPPTLSFQLESHPLLRPVFGSNTPRSPDLPAELVRADGEAVYQVACP
jgi:hypothetical protein